MVSIETILLSDFFMAILQFKNAKSKNILIYSSVSLKTHFHNETSSALSSETAKDIMLATTLVIAILKLQYIFYTECQDNKKALPCEAHHRPHRLRGLHI